MRRLILSVVLLLLPVCTAGAAIFVDVSATEVQVDDVVTLSVISDNTSPYSILMCIEDTSLGYWIHQDIRILPAAGSDASVVIAPDDPCIVLHSMSSVPATPIIAGEHFQVDYRATAVGTSIIEVYDFDLNPIQTITIQQTPEPTTIAMFALGGVILSRRRKRLVS